LYACLTLLWPSTAEEATAAWVAATLVAVVGSTAVADRSAAATEADMAVGTEADTALATAGEQVILADTRVEAPMVVDTVRVLQPLLTPGLGKDAVAPATLPPAGTVLTAVVRPVDQVAQGLLVGQAAPPLQPARAVQVSPPTQWLPMATGTPLDPAQS
jgi:hypothetical protein